jgi:UDP-N-acetylmuramoylalanine--D-glutamate ligase
MKLSELKDKKIVIVGFGIEGQASLQYLKHHFPNKEVAIMDQKDGPGYLDKLKDFDLAIKTAGIPRRHITIPYTTATNIFFANTTGKIIGITGSKGKSTTTSLIHDILKAADYDVKLVGNIGKPMLDELLSPEPKNRWYVAELSSYQLEDINYSPHISVMVNFFPDHLDYHGGLEAYWEAKKRIVAHATAEDYFIYNQNYERLVELAGESKAQAVPRQDALPFPDGVIPLIGKHNVDNVRMAVTVAHILKIEDKIIADAVEHFKPLSHRLEKVGTFEEITFFDDAISTTPESTIAAIEALPQIGTIFLGGTDRGYVFDVLVQKILEKGIENVVLFPDSGAMILATLIRISKSMGKKLPQILESRDMKSAVAFAYMVTPKNTVCLLSTASPSYSLWKNFEEKGGQFQQYVKEMAH